MRTLALAFLAILVLAMVKDASAACAPPAGPSVTRTEISITLHSYADGHWLCIHTFSTDPKNNCEHCKSGYWHECTRNRWHPDTPFNKCSSKEAKPYFNGVAQGAASGESARKNLLGDMLDGHKGAQGKIDNRNTQLSNQVRKDHSDLARRAIDQAQENLRRSAENLLNERIVSSGRDASGSDAGRCADLLEKQIEQGVRSLAKNDTDGQCNQARERLGMLTNVKNNLSRHGCHNATLDADIGNYRAFVRNHC